MRRLAVFAMVLTLLFGACGGEDEAPEPAAPDAAEETTEDDAAASDGFALETRDFFFSPAALTGEAGQEATVTISNTGEAPHTFTVEDLDIDEELQPGDEVEVTLTFPDSGTVDFICRFHSGQGMTGTLTVN